MRDLSSPNRVERRIALSFAAGIGTISPRILDCFLGELRLQQRISISDELETKCRLYSLAILWCATYDDETMHDFLISHLEVIKILLEPTFKIELAIINFLLRIFGEFREIIDVFSGLIPFVLNVYKTVPQRSAYFYHGIPDPWLRVKILQYLRAHEPPKLQKFVEPISGILQELFKETSRLLDNLRCHDHSAINSIFSIFFEGVKLAKHLQRSEMNSTIGNILQQAKRNLPANLYAVRSLLAVHIVQFIV
eukprot:Phypoly_transcript_15402.p1 GENE.Phypoly_transcript_15402~~Phypoly_transcript_15402.p1  ORF type:complete len:251 (+),score=19.00 Phypoly_transcript_15402:175-927(+)